MTPVLPRPCFATTPENNPSPPTMNAKPGNASRKSQQEPAPHAPSVTARRTLAAGRWLRLDEVQYRDQQGAVRTWESASRRNNVSAVCIIVRLLPSRRWLLVRQFRPPADSAVVEFPAGLVDTGETPEQAAVRELYEETGYRGRIVAVWPRALNTPGMTDEDAWFVQVDVDETAPPNQAPAPAPDPGEYIQVLRVHDQQLLEFLVRESQRGHRIDSKVLAFALGRAESATPTPPPAVPGGRPQ